MSRPKKEQKILNIRLAKDVNDELEKFCDETGLTKTIAVEKILHQYFSEYFKRSEEDRIIFK